MQIASFALSSIVEATHGRCHAEKPVGDIRIDQIIIDSRNYESVQSAIFIALVSRKNDGHRYVQPLYEAGVRCFLISCFLPEFSQMPDAVFIEVEDTLVALQQWAAWHRSRFSIPVVGITGSNGKTIVKEWMSFLLGFDKRVVRSPKSFNSQIGVPLSVLRMERGDDIGIFEAGISQVGEMRNLQPVMQPTIGILTNIGEAHDAGFADRLQKTCEKLQLFTSVNVLIFCADYPEIRDALTRGLLPGDTRFLCWSADGIIADTGQGENAKIVKDTRESIRTGVDIPHPSSDAIKVDLRIVESRVDQDGGRVLKALYKGIEHQVEIPFTDYASFENAVHCWLFMLDAGYPDEIIAARFRQLPSLKMRMEMKEGVGHSWVLNDAYSSDFSSFCMALDFLCNHAQGKSCCVIMSDILQSGRPESVLYGEVANVLEQKRIKELVAIGPALVRHENCFVGLQARFYRNMEHFLQDFRAEDFAGKAVLLKGARVFAFERIDALLQRRVHETVMEVNLSALVHNMNYFRSLLKPETKLMVMGKAFSYGSGSHEIADVLEFNHVDYVTVAYVDEAVALRNNGIRLPIMCMNAEVEGLETAIRYQVEPAIYNFRMLETLENYLSGSVSAQQSGVVRIHIGLDTGMHRMGFEEKDLDYLLPRLVSNPRFKVQSVYTHLATADMPEMDVYTRKQLEAYSRMSSRFRTLFPDILRHCLNTAGIFYYPEYQFDMVRLGIGLYGVGTDAAMQSHLETVSTLKAVISQIRTIPIGDAVGYGRRFVASRETRIGVIGIGYADGLNRHLGNGRYHVLVNGYKVPIVGSICMDMCMIDLTGVPAKEGDEVEIFGRSNPIEAMAVCLDTIPYEILTSVSLRVKRVYIND